MNSPQRCQLPSSGLGKSITRRISCGRDLRWKRCADVRFRAVITALLLWIGVTTSVVTSFGAVAEYSIDTWQVEQGLPDNSVTSIAQTPDGYLWFGTFNGLVRFDGVRFKVFDSRTPGLEGERVLRLFVDGQGGLWVSMEQGQLARYAAGRFRAFRREDGWPMEACLQQGIAREGSGSMIFLTVNRALVRFDGIRFHPVPVGQLGSAGASLVADESDGRLWLRHGDRLDVVNGDALTRVCEVQSTPQSEDESKVIARSRSGGVWIVEKRQLARICGSQGSVETIPYPLNALPVWMEEDSTGQIWAGTWGRGLCQLKRDGTFKTFTVAEGLPSDVIRVCFEDREGNLWIGTNGGGLARLKPKIFSSPQRSLWRINRELYPSPMADPIPLSLGEDPSGTLWVGCLDVGAFRVSPGFAADSGSIPQLDEKIGSTGVWAILASKFESRNTWFGSYGSGLGRLAGDEVKWWGVREGLPSAMVVALCEASDGTLWIGTDGGGLSRFDGQMFTNYTTREGLLSDQVRALTVDNTGALWIGTIGGGLNCLKDGRLTAFTRANGLPHSSVRALLADADGSLWIGTGGGLCLLRDRRLFAFDTVTDLAESEIAVILDDGLGYLWCGSNRGVVRIARAELEAFVGGESKRIKFTAYSKGDGLASPQVSAGQPAGLRTRDGRLWFATVKGVSLVDPRTLRLNNIQPSVVIEDALVDGKSEIQDTKSDRLIVPPGRRRVEIRYTGLSLTSPERVRFRRRVEGFDQDWQDVGTERVASYSGLPPGAYRFRVIAANSDGLWNTEGASLAFMVQPMLWQTWWFRSVLVLLFGGAVGSVYHQRVVRLDGQRLAQEEFSRGLIESQEQERKRIAAELHDSLGQNLLIIKNRALLGLASDGKETSHFHEISDTATQALQEVRQIAYHLRPYQLDQFGLTEAIEAIVEKVGASGTIHFLGDLHPIDGIFAPEAESHIFRVVQEATNNIVKHSGAAEARIVIQRNARDVKFVVSDDGRGFASEQAGATRGSADGVGLPGMRERVRILGGTIEIKSSPGRGTTITLIVPIPVQPNGGQQSNRR